MNSGQLIVIEQRNEDGTWNNLKLLQRKPTETKAEDMDTGEIAGALVKVRSNIERVEKEITSLKYSRTKKMEELKRKRDEDIETIEAKYKREAARAASLYSNKKVIEKENEIGKLESVEKEMKSKLLQSLAIPIPDKAIPECPACLEQMKHPMQIFNCPNGHLICSDCKPKNPRNLCTECKVPYAGRANGMEKMVRILMNIE